MIVFNSKNALFYLLNYHIFCSIVRYCRYYAYFEFVTFTTNYTYFENSRVFFCNKINKNNLIIGAKGVIIELYFG